MYSCQNVPATFLSQQGNSSFVSNSCCLPLPKMDWRSPSPGEEHWPLVLFPFSGKVICLFSNLWAPVPVSETLLKVRWWHLDKLWALFLKLCRISGKGLLLEVILVKWHPCELCVETKACCDLEETESLQSGISGLGPEVCKSASSVVSELSHAFILHGVNMSPIPSLVSFLPSYHVTIILQLVFYPPGGGGQLVSPIASLCFLLKTFCPLDFFFFLVSI